MPTVDEIQEFFFEGASRGWAGGGEYLKVPGKPRHKEFIHRSSDGKLWMSDKYLTVPGSRKSSGVKTIFASDGGEETPVWVMHYGGEYPENAIALLKDVLLGTYRARVFAGGRGLHRGRGIPRGGHPYDDANIVDLKEINGKKVAFTYQNRWRGSFSRFEGREAIIDVFHKHKEYGYHKFFGMLLI